MVAEQIKEFLVQFFEEEVKAESEASDLPQVESPQSRIESIRRDIGDAFDRLDGSYAIGIKWLCGEEAPKPLRERFSRLHAEGALDLEKALSHAREKTDILDQGDFESLVESVENLLKEGESANALYLSSVLITLFPSRPLGYALALSGLENLEGPAAAARIYSPLVKIFPDPFLLFFAAECEERCGNDSAALRYLHGGLVRLETDTDASLGPLQKATLQFQEELEGRDRI